jgi:hypothetical protein
MANCKECNTKIAGINYYLKSKLCKDCQEIVGAREIVNNLNSDATRCQEIFDEIEYFDSKLDEIEKGRGFKGHKNTLNKKIYDLAVEGAKRSEKIDYFRFLFLFKKAQALLALDGGNPRKNFYTAIKYIDQSLEISEKNKKIKKGNDFIALILNMWQFKLMISDALGEHDKSFLCNKKVKEITEYMKKRKIPLADCNKEFNYGMKPQKN